MDMASGLKLIKQELGPNALILSTRTIRNGKFGLVGKPILEITAAVDSDFPGNSAADPDRNLQSPDAETPPDTRSGFRHVVDDSVEDFLSPPVAFRYAEDETSKDTASWQDTANEQSSTSNRIKTQSEEHPASKQHNDLQSEINALKDLVLSLSGKITQISQKEARATETPQLRINYGDVRNRFDSTSIHGDFILSMLTDHGVNVETARAVATFLKESLTEQERSATDIVLAAIMGILEHLIPTKPPDFAKQEGQQRIALVGPTGVGKTTTLAKIAAAYLSKYAHSVALITIDTYRIAAVEQLKVYGEIMKLPVEVVINPQQLQQAIERHSDKKLILIDTAGRSPRDGYCISELADFLKPELNIDKHLVLSATTRENELLDAIERFQCLGITQTIFTKIDECTNLGILLNVQVQNPNPLSYFTNGQRVPEDLLEASSKLAAELIMSPIQGSMHD